MYNYERKCRNYLINIFCGENSHSFLTFRENNLLNDLSPHIKIIEIFLGGSS